MTKYSWKASSNDGSFEDKGQVWFDTHKEAYYDMQKNALEKMKWNTEWCDFSDMADEDYIKYVVHFHPKYITHKSYSGTYTYEIVEREDKVYLHEREWEVIDKFTPKIMYDWNVCIIEGVGSIWMNNVDGYIVLMESNRILKSYI